MYYWKHFTETIQQFRQIHADVIVYIFAHLHTALRKEGNMLDMNWLQAAKELVKLSTWEVFSSLGVIFKAHIHWQS